MMTTKTCLLLAALLPILGCSSREAFPWDAPLDVPEDEAGEVAAKDAGLGLDAPYEALDEVSSDADGCVGLIGAWPCDGSLPFWPDAPYDVGFKTSESGLSRRYVSTDMAVRGSVSTNPAVPDGGISESDVPQIVFGLLQRGDLPWDPDGVYVLLPSREVVFDPELACLYYCGYHEFASIATDGGSGLLRYAVVMDTGSCPSQCSAFAPGSATPNRSLSADTMVNIIAHELAESATDPDPWKGWSTAWFSEVGDVCAWSFGDVFVEPSGAPYNQEVGGQKVLIQEVYDQTEECTLGARGFDVGAATPLGPDSGLLDYPPAAGPMYYRGGRVLDQPIHVYWIWLGQWTDRPTIEPIITGFVNGLGSSGWWASPAAYFSEPALYEASDGGE